MRIIFAVAPRRLFAGGAGIFAALAFAMLASACSDSPTGSTMGRLWPGGALTGTEFQLEGVEVTACQYGGEYPNCKSAPIDDGYDPNLPPSGGSTGTTTGGDGGGGGSTTGTTTPPPDSTSTCDPYYDPNCEQPLTKTDSTTILAALTNFVRADSTIADTVTRRRCREMHDQFMRSFNSGMVFRGASDTPGDSAHYGATLNKRIHFDPAALSNAASDPTGSDARELANTALHEAAHVLGYSHPKEADANGIYTDVPFNLLPPGPGPCLK